ncbi:MAG: GntR family transcriptional regulator [Pseudomonadota bacterium]
MSAPAPPVAVRSRDTTYPLSRRQAAANQLLEIMRARIIRGELPPGSRIIERALCEEMNISRTPLREALKLLELDGLVDLTQNRGARVSTFTAEEALNLFEVLAGLEGLAAELAVTRIDEASLETLERLHDQMQRCFDTGDKDGYFDLNSTIHSRIIEASGNPVLAHTQRALMLRAKRGRYMAIVDPDRWEQALGEHDALMNAFRQGDAQTAGRIWRTHLMHTGETVARVLQNEGPNEAYA